MCSFSVHFNLPDFVRQKYKATFLPEKCFLQKCFIISAFKEIICMESKCLVLHFGAEQLEMLYRVS